MLSSWSTLEPCKPLSQIIQEQEDERMAKQYQLELSREEDHYWEEVELVTKLSKQEKPNVPLHQNPPQNSTTHEFHESSEEEENNPTPDESYPDYYIERQNQNFNPNLTLIQKTSHKTKPKKTTNLLNPEEQFNQNTGAAGPENLEIPAPDYNVSTSCGRVYKNRIPRPITTGANKTRENGPLEVEKNTGVPGLFLIYNFLSPEEETTLLTSIENLPWASNRANTRRVQLYVPWKEEPKFVIVPKAHIAPLPPQSKKIAKKNHSNR